MRNPFSIYFDPSCQQADYSDARYAFIVEDIPKDEFKAQYGDDSSNDIFASIGDRSSDWMPEGKVRIAEYFYVEEDDEEIALLSNDNEVPTASLKSQAVLAQMAADQITIRRKRKVKTKHVRWAKITGTRILERGEWAGKFIPIVPVLGDESDINGMVDLKGMVRDAREPQRMYNYWIPLALDTPIPTPTGWTTMGEIQVGDKVFDNKGHICDVIGISPTHVNRDCFQVTFDDGSSIIADREHPWQVEERGRRLDPTWDWKTKQVTTGELTPNKHFIWATKPLMLDDVDLPVNPYVLGVWLSDGRSEAPDITQNMRDIGPLRQALAEHGARFGNIGISGENAGRFTVNGIRHALVENRLLNNKHIPNIYLRASLRQRLALLQGLMDGDGSIAKRSRVCEFSTGSTVMRDGMAELLRTVGIKAKCICREPRTATLKNGHTIIGRKPVYQFSFTAPPPEAMPVFALPRKFESQRAKNGIYHPRRTDRFCIRSVEPVESVPVKCIAVSSPDHLFLAGIAMIPTHNSSQTETIALAPKAPFVGVEGQFEGHEGKWNTANRRSWPYLEYKAKSFSGQFAPPPERQQLEPPIQAMTIALRQADNDLKATTGLYDASLGERGPDESGRAILARQKQGDMSTSHWVDNLMRGLRFLGRQMIDLIPKIYDVPRVIRILGADNQPQMVMVHANNQEAVDQQQRHQQIPDGIKGIYDLGAGRFDVTASVGPSYQSRRQEAVVSLLEFMKAFPPAAQAVGDILAENMDWPGANTVAKRLKKMVPPQLLDDPQGKMSPEQMQAQMASAQQQIQMLQQELQQAQMSLQTEQVQAQSRERIAAMQEQTKVKLAMAQHAMTADASNRDAQIQGASAQSDQQQADSQAESDRLQTELSHHQAAAGILQERLRLSAEQQNTAEEQATARHKIAQDKEIAFAKMQNERDMLNDEQQHEVEMLRAEHTQQAKVEIHKSETVKSVAKIKGTPNLKARVKRPGGQ